MDETDIPYEDLTEKQMNEIECQKFMDDNPAFIPEENNRQLILAALEALQLPVRAACLEIAMNELIQAGGPLYFDGNAPRKSVPRTAAKLDWRKQLAHCESVKKELLREQIMAQVRQRAADEAQREAEKEPALKPGQRLVYNGTNPYLPPVIVEEKPSNSSAINPWLWAKEMREAGERKANELAKLRR